MSTNPKVLLLSVIPSDFSKLLSLAHLLRRNSIEVEFFFDQRAHSLAKSIQEAENNSFYSHYSISKHKKDSFEKKRRWDILKKIKILIFLKRLISERRNCKKIESSFRTLLKARKITLLVTSLNMYGYNLPIYLEASKKEGVKSACLPFAIGDKDGLEKAIIFAQPKSSPDYLFNSFFGRIFPKWRLYTLKGIYLGLPAETLLAYWLSGISVKIPISFYGLEVDYLLLDNEYMMEHAKKQGIAAKHTSVTGAIFDDKLFELQQNKEKEYKLFCAKYFLNENKKCILFALPPLVKKNESDTKLLDFSSLMESFFPKSIEYNNYNVIISPHPRIEGKYFEKIQLNSNIIIAKVPAEILLPLSDLFITTYSSTIRSAATLGIPILNYDLLNFQYNLFSDLENIITVKTEKDYIDNLKEWMFNNSIKEQKCKPSSNKLNSNLDGKAEQRILSKLNELIER